MLKKVIPIVFSLCLICSVSAMAEKENTTSEVTIPEMSQEIPQNAGERPMSGRGGMGMTPSDNMQNNDTSPAMPNGEMPWGGISGGQTPQGAFTPPRNNVTNNAATAPQTDGNTAAENAQIPENAGEANQVPEGNAQFGNWMAGGMGESPDNMQNSNRNTQPTQETGLIGFVQTYSTPITSVILLILAYIFVLFYKRKHY